MSALRWGIVLKRRPFMQQTSGPSRHLPGSMLVTKKQVGRAVAWFRCQWPVSSLPFHLLAQLYLYSKVLDRFLFLFLEVLSWSFVNPRVISFLIVGWYGLIGIIPVYPSFKLRECGAVLLPSCPRSDSKDASVIGRSWGRYPQFHRCIKTVAFFSRGANSLRSI